MVDLVGTGREASPAPRTGATGLVSSTAAAHTGEMFNIQK